MTNYNFGRQLLGVVLTVLLLSGCSSGSPTPEPEPTSSPNPPTNTPAPTATARLPDKILFIGNSFTFWNDGLDFQMKQLIGSANPPLNTEAESVVRAGAPLEIMWKITDAPEAIEEGDYDVVVLQGDIPESDVETFQEYARRFVEAIDKAGAEPVLFMAWPYERLGWITLDEIAQAHFEIALELGVDVAPVGLAWQRAMAQRPELDMYGLDKEHPSVYGSYLAVNVVYATVFGVSPVGLSYLPPERTYFLSNGKITRGITQEEAAFLQRIAWETVQQEDQAQ